MKPACEIIVKEILPAVRALITRELVEIHGFTQKKAAEKMGMTQPAVSQYKKELRGYKAKLIQKNKKLNRKITEIGKGIYNDKMTHQDAVLEFCEICKDLRKKGILCDLHISSSPSLSGCDICLK